jgi:hypothetical protein
LAALHQQQLYGQLERTGQAGQLSLWSARDFTMVMVIAAPAVGSDAWQQQPSHSPAG